METDDLYIAMVNEGLIEVTAEELRVVMNELNARKQENHTITVTDEEVKDLAL